MLSTRELCRLAGVTYRQADYWTRCGYLRPDRPATGSGSQRVWGLDEVTVATALRQLVGVVPARQLTTLCAWLRAEQPRGPVLVDVDGCRTDDLTAARWVVQLPLAPVAVAAA